LGHQGQIGTLLEAKEAAAGLTDEDAIPELPATPTTVAGDLLILGEHRVRCGDATEHANVARLIAGGSADLVFTDPPYNVDYEGYTEERLKIKGNRMTPEQFQQFLLATFSTYRNIVKPGASMYVCHSSSWQREFQNSVEATRSRS
jgi:DNA modification methylase